MQLQDLFDLKGKDEMKECQDRFCLLFVPCHGASTHVALVRGNESEQKVQLADLL